MVEIVHAQQESIKLSTKEVNLWLPLLKSTKNVITIFGNHFFQRLGAKFSNQKSIPCV